MGSWTNATPTGSEAGVLHPDDALRHFTLERPPCDPGLSPWVERYWAVGWDLPPGRVYVSEVLPHPALHLTVEWGSGPRHGHAMPAVLLHGVVTRRFSIPLSASGGVLGVRFRPGGWAAWTGREASALTDLVVPGDGPLDEVLRAGSTAERVAVFDEWLLARRPDPDPVHAELLEIVATMLSDRSLTAVEAVCERFGVSHRTLQRRFRHYVGVGPKWVLRRYRLHDAVRLIDEGDPRDLATLAADLGWFDQAHFSREFAELVGVSPSAYAARSVPAR